MICLYNNLGNSNVATNSIANNKTTIYNCEYERKYPDGFSIAYMLTLLAKMQ